MLKLEENEKILMLIRRHWFVMTKPAIVFVFLLIAPSIALSILPSFIDFNKDIISNVANFLLSIYILTLMLFLFIVWADYYLDIWIITSKRIIDIEQRGLFDRSISEFNLANVQDVTIEISGVIQTLLKFGNLRVETASESNFTIKDAPNLYEAKDFILKYAEIARQK